MADSKPRLPYWDNLKGVLILLVVFGHMLQMLPGGSESAVYKLIYLFHMPMFVFCSGYLGSFAPKKILRALLLPYLVLQVLCCLLTKQPVQLFTPYWMLWYLPALAVWRFCIPLLNLCGRRGVLPCLFGLLLLGCLAGYCGHIGYFLSLSRIFVFCPYFAAGYFLKTRSGWDKLRHMGHFPKLCAALAAVLCLCLFLWSAPKIPAEWLYGAESYAAVGSAVWFRLSQYGAAAVIGLALLLFLPARKTVFGTVGKNSFLLYAAHIAVLPIFRLLPAIHPYLQPVLCLLAAILFCTAVTWIRGKLPQRIHL